MALLCPAVMAVGLYPCTRHLAAIVLVAAAGRIRDDPHDAGRNGSSRRVAAAAVAAEIMILEAAMVLDCTNTQFLRRHEAEVQAFGDDDHLHVL